MLKLISLTGLVAFIALAWAISFRRGRFPWRTVLTGLGLQVVLAAILIPDTIIGRSLYTFADGVATMSAGRIRVSFHNQPTGNAAA